MMAAMTTPDTFRMRMDPPGLRVFLTATHVGRSLA
jgi:hypothetical protein